MSYSIMALVATQIIIESLPISSSGHVMLLERLLDAYGVSLPMLPEHFDHLLHFPTIIIVALYFRKVWWSIVKKLSFVCAAWWSGTLRAVHIQLLHILGRIICMVVLANGATACCYGITKIVFKQSSWMQSLEMLLIGFCVTMGVLLSTKWYVFVSARLPMQISCHSRSRLWSKCILLGLLQGLALFPGVSRFAITVVGAQWLGMSARRALQFSFACFFPLMVIACSGHGIPLLFEPTIISLVRPLLAGITLCVVLIAYLFFVGACRLVLNQKMWWFGVYMLLPIACIAKILFFLGF